MSLKEKRAKMLRAADLYLVITSEFCAGRSALDVLTAACDGGIRIAQMREKSLCGRELVKRAVEFRKICDRYQVLMIMNDRPDIAQYVGADGVHLGQDDLPIDVARCIGPDLIIGRSTHSPEQALEAEEQGADYVNLGPLFATNTKSLRISPLGPEIIASARPLLKIPFSVMGGIKARHIPDLLQAGARLIAMVTEVTQAQNVTEKVRELRAFWTH